MVLKALIGCFRHDKVIFGEIYSNREEEPQKSNFFLLFFETKSKVDF